MIFSGLPFLFEFLPLTLAGFALVSRWGEGWAKYWLILMSLVFYAVGARAFLPLLVLSVAANYGLLHCITGSRQAGRWATLGVALNLTVLVWFKYLSPDTLPPLGLSFFTFTQIGCLLHFAQDNDQPPKARDYALYASFFPALLAGPILNPRETLEQFARTTNWFLTSDNMSVGLGYFVIGLLKKTVLANQLSGLVNSGFADPSSLTMMPAWEVAAAYSLQLYFDFSGYSDMAIGLARMFGIAFPDNFDRPYRSRSVIAYWQCWHMSLTRFLMTNVHAPLTMAILRWRRGKGLPIGQNAQRSLTGFFAMIGAPIILTMALVSLWHGTAATFAVFGLLHIAFLLTNHVWRLYQAPALPGVISVGLTYLCVLMASVFFRAPDVSTAESLLGGMIGFNGSGTWTMDIRALCDVGWIFGLYTIVWFLPSTRQIMTGSTSLAWRPSPQWAVMMGCATTLGVLATGGNTEFVYFQF